MAKKKKGAAGGKRTSSGAKISTPRASGGEAPWVVSGTRTGLRDLRRHRLLEVVEEIVGEALRQERDAARALVEMAEASAAVPPAGRRVEPSRRVRREIDQLQQRVLDLARRLEPFHGRVREVPDELTGAALGLAAPRASIDDATEILREAAERLSTVADDAASMAGASERAQVAAVNLALEASRGGEARAWVDHAERVRSLASSAVEEGRNLASSIEEVARAIAEIGLAAGEAGGIFEECSGSISAEAAGSAGPEVLATGMGREVARIRDDCLVQGLLVHELGQIEEAVRLDEERSRELVRGARSAVRARVVDPITKALEGLKKGRDSFDGAQGSVEQLRQGVERVRLAAAEHEQHLVRLVQVQTDLQALRRRQSRILSSFPDGTIAVAERLDQLAGSVESGREDLGAIDRRIERTGARLNEVAERLEGEAVSLRSFARLLDSRHAGVATIDRTAIRVEALASVGRLTAREFDGTMLATLEALDEATLRASDAATRSFAGWRSVQDDLRRVASLLEEASARARQAQARLERTRAGLSSGREELVELVEVSGQLRASFGGAQEWSAEALQGIEGVSGRAELVREAAENGSRAGSKLRLALRGLDATADELDHLTALL